MFPFSGRGADTENLAANGGGQVGGSSGRGQDETGAVTLGRGAKTHTSYAM